MADRPRPAPPWARATGFLSGGVPVAFAHRGGAAEAPENSRAAFDNAARLGYRFIETDLRATSDGVLLAFHDARLDRLTDHRGRIRDLPWREVRRIRLSDGSAIPRLDDLLGDLPDVRVNIDIKEAAAIAPMVDVLGRTGAAGRVCVTSFSGARLRSARRVLGPSVVTSLAPDEVLALRRTSGGSSPPARLATALAGGAVAAQVPERLGRAVLVDERFVRQAHGVGLQVHVWTVNEEAAMDRLLDLGVDGIMTDRPTLLREVLLRRGQWTGSTGASRNGDR